MLELVRITEALARISHTTDGLRNGCGRHERQNSHGIKLVIAATAAPIVGENSIGMCASCRAFQVAISRSASANICGPRKRLASASFTAAAWRSLSILRLLGSVSV